MVSIFQVVGFCVACLAWAYAIRATGLHFLDKNKIKISPELKGSSLRLIFALLMQLGSFLYVVLRLQSLSQI